ncbi:MAG: alcohol dehydrogenase [Alphaproteobacteria bacterium]|nr:alcohol dehydrogenase [Alphaproteobacteria bacterium]
MISYEIQDWGKPLQQAVREQPVPQGTEVLVQVKYCGICHSDVHIRDGYFDLGGGKKFHMSERGMKPPVIMGHEPYGTVVGAGPEAKEVPMGKDVLVYPWTGCGTCPRCLEGMDNWCPTPRFLGIQKPGGYAQHMLVPHPRYLIDANGIDPAYAPVLACSGLTTYSAARKLMPCSPTDWIVVMGAGGLGLMAVAMLRALGHSNIAVCEIDSRKWPAAQDLGALHTFDPTNPEALAQLMALPGGVWGVLDLVGAESTATLGLAALRKGGRYVVVGLYGGQIPVSLVPMAQRAITLQGSYVGSPQELREVVALAQSGRLPRTPTHLCAPEEISATLDQLKAGQVIGRVVAQWA